MLDLLLHTQNVLILLGIVSVQKIQNWALDGESLLDAKVLIFQNCTCEYIGAQKMY